MTGWHLYWTVWFFGSFLAFLAPEIYALCTDWRNTLSAYVWNFESYMPGQPVWAWSAAHYLFAGVYLTTVSWLAGHFLLGWWRS